MSKKHPVVVVTGSSGAGTSTVKKALESIFHRQKIRSVIIEGDSFHRYDRAGMQHRVEESNRAGINFSHFGEAANQFGKLEELFRTYGENGTGQKRFYLHNDDEAKLQRERLGIDCATGEFTPWEDIEPDTDLLFYEGLHGLVKTADIDMTRYVDLKVGVVPVVNLEWIQKIHRDSKERGYSKDEVIDNILRRMPDYVKYITPQFSETDINFQRVATVDTSNPFIARDIPTPDESFVVIRFRKPDIRNTDFTNLLSMISGSFMSRRNTIVVPGGKMGMAMEIVLMPIISDLMRRRDRACS
ncbi:MAG: phosphoribulokinase [Gammaproteobacteria bacterium]|nr:phosphoribulokinase [Gammaproteobacteria bacterium]MDH3534129.1 phosphoribulokinase [Gammaproteobacteria bacterium]